MNKCRIVPSSAITRHFCKKVVKQLGLSESIILDIGDLDDNGRYDIADFLTMKNEEILKMNQGQKFDICLMNPPYAKSLHLQFLEKAIQICDNVVSVQPVRWLEDPLAKNKKNADFNKFNDSIIKYINNIEVISNDMARLYFNAGINTSLAIYNCNNIGGFDVNKLQDTIIKKIIDKLNKENNTLDYYIEKNKFDGWRVRFVNIVGGSHTKDNKKDIIKAMTNLLYFYNGYKDKKLWYNFYQRNQFTKITQNIPLSIKFSTEVECINFINSFKTDFILYIILKTTLNTTVSTKCIPFMPTYNKNWTNEMFYKYFDLTKDEIQTIEDYMNKIKNKINKK